MKWGDNRTLKFMRLYRLHPCLWDTASPDYNVRQKRDDALNAILTAMNIPNFSHAACKMKIKNIRSQYCHELKKIRLSIKAGSKVHKPTLAWFDTVDSFLRPIVIQRTKNIIKFSENNSLNDQTETSSDNVVDMEFVDYSKKNIDDTSNEETVLKTEELNLSDMESENVYEETMETYAPSRQVEPISTGYCAKYDSDSEKQKEESENLRILTTAIKKLENSVLKHVTASAVSNEFDVFGQSVAAQLTNMPLGEALQLQMEIQQLITTKRISALNKANDNRR